MFSHKAIHNEAEASVHINTRKKVFNNKRKICCIVDNVGPDALFVLELGPN